MERGGSWSVMNSSLFTSNCMHGMIQTEAWLQHMGTLWNASVSMQCKHYQKLTASHHFGGYVLPGILNP